MLCCIYRVSNSGKGNEHNEKSFVEEEIPGGATSVAATVIQVGGRLGYHPSGCACVLTPFYSVLGAGEQPQTVLRWSLLCH